MPQPTLGFTNDRVLIADLDSTVQASLVDAWRDVDNVSHEELLTIALARLRVESLLSETIVITDAQAFDGGVLTQLVAADKLSGLQRLADEPLPLDLRLRDPDASRALFLMYHNEDSQPKGFLPSLFRDGRAISAALAEARIPRIRGLWRGGKPAVERTTALLKDVGVDEDELAGASEAWHKVLELVASERLETSTWGSSPTFTQMLEAAEHYWPAARLRADHCRTSDTSELLDQVIALGPRRGDVHNLLTLIRDSGPDEDTATAVEFMLHWYDERYRRAQAFQHEADYRGSDTGLASRRSGFEHVLIPRPGPGASAPDPKILRLQIPPGFLEYVGELPLANWQLFVGSQIVRLRRWWKDGDSSALAEVFDALSRDADDAATGRPDPAGQSIKVFSSVAERVGSLALNLDPKGVGIVVLLYFAQSIIESAALDSPMRASVEVTDYYDEIVL